MASELVIDARGIVTRFGDRTIHDGVSFTARRGEVTAIVGGSGTGKSTLMREVVMLHRPSAGSIELLGHEVTELSDIKSLPLRRQIGVMFQHGALFGDLNLLENVSVPLREHTALRQSTIAELALFKIALVGLQPAQASLYPSQLSGGMRKRAAVARALALDPAVLFLDEPSSGLDPVSADALDELILQLKRMLGLTIVLVTHDMDSLWKIADHVVLLGRGHVLGSGSMAELARSEEPEVRAFFAGARGRSSARAHSGKP